MWPIGSSLRSTADRYIDTFAEYLGMPVVLSSYSAIALGVILVVIGYAARRRGNEYSRYLLAGGGILVLLGMVGLLLFVRAFG